MLFRQWTSMVPDHLVLFDACHRSLQVGDGKRKDVAVFRHPAYGFWDFRNHICQLRHVEEVYAIFPLFLCRAVGFLLPDIGKFHT